MVFQISVLPILGTEDHNLNDDDECAARQMVRHVCVALKRYMESHLFYKYTQLSRLNEPSVPAANAVPLFRVSSEFRTEIHLKLICFYLLSVIHSIIRFDFESGAKIHT